MRSWLILYVNVPFMSSRKAAWLTVIEIRRGGHYMPVLFIEAPQGIRPEKKSEMMRKITEAVDEAYHIGDTLIFRHCTRI